MSDGGYLYQHLLGHAAHTPWLIQKHKGAGAWSSHSLGCRACGALLTLDHPYLGKGGVVDHEMISLLQQRTVELLWKEDMMPPHVRDHLKDTYCAVERIVPGSVVQGSVVQGTWVEC